MISEAAGGSPKNESAGSAPWHPSYLSILDRVRCAEKCRAH